jgi:hypothetical protein
LAAHGSSSADDVNISATVPDHSAMQELRQDLILPQRQWHCCANLGMISMSSVVILIGLIAVSGLIFALLASMGRDQG